MSDHLFANDYTVLKQCKHGYFLFNRNDLFIGRALDLYGEWCEAEIMTIAELVKPGDIVIDVGANIGTHTIAFAKMVTATGLVVAIEAQRAVYHCLVANIVINNLLNVFCMNNAAGAERGTVLVPALSPTVANNFGALNVASQAAGEVVQLIPLDSLNLSSCRLIKIDVEGMEPAVLKGAQRMIQKLRPFIFVETTLVNGAEVIDLLLSFRYNCYWHIADYYNPANSFGNAENVFKGIHPETNLVCFPSELNIVPLGLEPVSGPGDDWQKALDRIRDKRKTAL